MHRLLAIKIYVRVPWNFFGKKIHQSLMTLGEMGVSPTEAILLD